MRLRFSLDVKIRIGRVQLLAFKTQQRLLDSLKMLFSCVLLLGVTATMAETIVTSRVFVIPIGPEMFNWSPNGNRAEFSYQASLINAPDLPPWIHYTYSARHRRGFIYGVAAKDQGNFQLEIVGLNKKTFETSYRVLDMQVQEKENVTRYEVYMKIDNLNIEETFDTNRMERLVDIFRTELWTEAQDLYVTYLASAVEEGARLPLNPNEPEGVVLKLGSSVPFSHVLNDFEEELKPLRRRSPCPKDFKRTSKEIFFRQANFRLDWCSFKLIAKNPTAYQESVRRPSINVIHQPSSGAREYDEWRWARPRKSEIPTRNYLREISTSVFVPTSLLLVLAILLSTTLCLHHEKIEKREPSPVENSGKNGVQMVQYAASKRGTLRSLSTQPSSPNNSLLRSQMSRVPAERTNPYVRPNPPPYIGPSNIGARVDF